MPLPMTTPVSVPFVCWTICWAAARVSKLTLFHCASRCSVIRRIFIFRPFLRNAKKKHCENQRRPPQKKTQAAATNSIARSKAGAASSAPTGKINTAGRTPALLRPSALQDPRFVAQFFNQLGRDFFGLAGDEFGFLGFLRHVDAFDTLGGGVGNAERATVDRGDFFFLGGHDAFQGGVARLVDAGLDREDGGQRQLD